MSVDSIAVTPAEPKMSLLAFGDSLTSGVVGGGVTHPYSKRLQQLLGQRCNIVNKGRAGEEACHMQERLRQELQKARTSGSPFTHTIVLAGTNDLRVGTPEEEIFQGILALYQTCREMGSRVVAVTLPRYGPRDKAFKPQGQRRAYINGRIKEAVRAATEDEPGSMTLVDFDAALEAQQPCAVRDALFIDSCHFTPPGYDLLGKAIFEALGDAAGVSTALLANGADRADPVQPPKSMTTSTTESYATTTPRPRTSSLVWQQGNATQQRTRRSRSVEATTSSESMHATVTPRLPRRSVASLATAAVSQASSKRSFLSTPGATVDGAAAPAAAKLMTAAAAATTVVAKKSRLGSSVTSSNVHSSATSTATTSTVTLGSVPARSQLSFPALALHSVQRVPAAVSVRSCATPVASVRCRTMCRAEVRPRRFSHSQAAYARPGLAVTTKVAVMAL